MDQLSRKDRVLIEQLVQKYGKKELLEMQLPKKSWPYILAAGLSTAGIFGTNKIGVEPSYNNEIDAESKNQYGMSEDDYKLFQAKVDCVENEIGRVLGLNNKSIGDIQFDIDYLVYCCYEYGYDLPLMLAQMQAESHFGTTPRAKKTNSVFSVGLWDNKTLVTYDNQNDCFIPYIKLMQNDYLQDGNVSIDNLLQKGKFVNHRNERYASDKNYERTVRNIRDSLIRRYPVLSEPFSTTMLK